MRQRFDLLTDDNTQCSVLLSPAVVRCIKARQASVLATGADAPSVSDVVEEALRGYFGSSWREANECPSS